MNNLNEINNSLIFNNRVNFAVASEKGLIKDKDSTLYSFVQGLYIRTFEELLLSKVDLKKYDDMIKNSDLDFGVVDLKNKLIYHHLSHMNLSYIYIRNFFFIEKLDNDDLNYFVNKIKSNDLNVDSKLLEIVQRTYSDVMIDNFRTTQYIDPNTTIAYGPHSEINDCPADSLCIYIHYGKNTKELTGEDYWDNRKKKDEFLEKIADEITSLVSQNLNIKVTVKIRHILAA